MDTPLFKLYLIRHGNTAWSETRRHTGLTDLPLNEHGEHDARLLGDHLKGMNIAHTYMSPLLRARQTCELAGFADKAEISNELIEWNYGDYEGQTTSDICRQRPDWNIFFDGAPAGESPQDVAARADRFIERARRVQGDVAAFSSAHIIRVIAARWLGLAPDAGRYFLSSTASVGILGYEHNSKEPALHLWNKV